MTPSPSRIELRERGDPAQRFSLLNFIEHVVLRRQVEKQADTFIIIYGRERSGKSTLGFQLLIPYVNLMKNIAKGNYEPYWLPSDYPREKLWDPHPPHGTEDRRCKQIRWSHILKSCFAGDAYDAMKKIKTASPGSPLIVDEGTDVASWMEQMTREQKGLVHLLKKSGKKLMPTILITPSMSLLNKEMMRRAHFLFMIPDEPGADGNYAFLFRNYDNPILAESQPFGFNSIKRDVKKRSDLKDKESFKDYLSSSPRFMTAVKFGSIDERLYELYDRVVKDPLINKSNPGKKYISVSKHEKVRHMLDTVLYNLYTKDGKSYAQIRKLLTDKFGNVLASSATIRKYVDAMSMREDVEVSDVDVLGVDDAGGGGLGDVEDVFVGEEE